ncbi:MAG: murein biosynthesis integral membrane protein MurJ, partial [Nocardiopsaceae bacterium]|nr:murein biosynthesis integral membrane protein MurJ [Nocardiopsaceae bacterium]
PSFTPSSPGRQPPDPCQPPLPPNARRIMPESQPRTPVPRAPGAAGSTRPKPTFTPRRDSGGPSGPGPGGKPGPSFTPREGYAPPPGDPGTGGGYPPPTAAFFAPAGYPEPSFQPSFAQRADAPPPTVPPREGETGRDGRTQVLDAPGREMPRPPTVRDTGPQRTSSTQPNLMQSSKAMALGTIASRGTGFLRTLILVVALGSGTLANAYNNSNNLPNTVYYLMLGGIFTSVVVPLLVKATKIHPDKGEAYAERIFTLGAIALLLVTIIGTALAAPIVDLYMPGVGGSEHRVAVLFAYFFIPQIFFYGMDSLLGAILNTKGKFGPNMWTPVINNVVVIAVFGLFLVSGAGKDTSDIGSFGLDLLGFGTTLGIVIQSLALFPIVRRAGFSFRLRFDFRRDEVSEIGGMAGWMLGYVVAQFLANLVLQIVANRASSQPGATSNGYSAYTYAYLLFQLPYAIVGLSVISALLPRMSGHATDRRYSLVREDFSTGVRLASVIVVPAAVFLGVLGAPICELLFGWGRETVSEARYTGEVFGLLSLGLIPFMVTQLQLRVFYSFQNNRGPALIGVVMFVVGAVGDFVALAVLPAKDVVLGLGAAYGLMTLVGAAIAWPMLLRHVGSLDGWRITRSLVRMFLATLPGLAWAFVTMAVVGSLIKQGPVYGFVSTLVGGGGALLLFALCARVLGIEEFRVLIRTVGGRLGR